MSMIELRRLRAFVTVVEEGNITRAAERLFIQQPPLTRLLQGLEEELGVKLLQRLPRGVRVTEAGSVLFNEARALLTRAEHLTEAVHRAARGEQGHIAIGFTSSAALHPFVPNLLRRYREILPGITTQLEEAGSGELLDALVDERLDVAFVRSPVGAIPGLTIEPVLREPMLIALPIGHPLATHDDQPLPLTALTQEAFILYRRPAGQGLYDAILAACHGAGFSPRVIQEAPRLPATLSLVGAGLGLSIVPASMRRLGGDGIVYRTIAEQAQLSAPLYLALRSNRTSAIIQRFRDLVAEAVSEQSPG
ncbi:MULTISPECIES: LysR family transcriptional regulator [Serratia]|jgi:DNA-binding transcriptional LysR family regulator|uniref:LysR family transcriptional regulator n=1 Tax=Serratia TaxID=613 RepID=UPI001020B0CA|nr:LysR family transcriptional regulator [Serratia liquefaciens]MBV0841857.1 LysR family transcriptional regulator [Serratia liquefaciens]RYM71662.1 LysR family transcriptional regulator [Serratia liquefaciens]RYM81859.1 LysR family transcriptional regulator [Serratia liquefaciens]CAI0733728.1 Ben and cat operon transcriptional regulator [Serratia liquefaciens]CAI2442668.1 Ben and cat operon transcriptional regulator [Serratia liquefaciens]